LRRAFRLFILLFVGCAVSASAQSVLSEGNWFKVGVIKSGVYKINYSFLKSTGLLTNTSNPRNIRIFGNGGAILPQANHVVRKEDLVQNAIFVSGEDDGKFDKNDFILFYAEGPHVLNFDKDKNLFNVVQNIYSDTSYYFINLGEEPGKRIELLNAVEGGTTVSTYNEVVYHELELNNILATPVIGVESGSGREWYGESFERNTVKDFEVDLSDIDNSTPLRISSSVLSCSTTPATFKLTIGGVEFGAHSVPAIIEGTYNIKGNKDDRVFSTVTAVAGKTTLSYEYSSSGRGFLNNFIINFNRALKMRSPNLIFRSVESLNYPVSGFVVQNASANIKVWDITDPSNVLGINSSLENNLVSFSTPTETLKEFVAFDVEKIEAPLSFGKVANQNLHALAPADFIIVTHPDFKSAALQLANFRQEHSGLSVEVVTTREIYNEFSSGKQDITAIRDFLRIIYNRDSKLKYALLFGDCSFDYKNRVKDNTNFVPIYESRESLHPIRSYSSDDYFAFFEESEGEWIEDSKGDHTMEIGIGRIPCKTLEEAFQVVNKIMGYSNNARNMGSWRNRVTFVADDGDANTHLYDAERLSTLLDTSASYLNIKKIYLSSYPEVTNPDVTSPKTKSAINEAIDLGTLILNYTGHGGETGWTNEKILDTRQIRDWNNKEKLPLFVTATCEFGKYDNPNLKSGAEEALLNPRGGAIALVTTTRPVFSSTNFILNKAFYESAFQKAVIERPTLGDIIKFTKNNSLNGSINRNFALLGDPSLTLAYPEFNVDIQKINGKEITGYSDTLKALEEVKIEGQIKDLQGVPRSDFNGEIQMTIFDKSSITSTLGNEETPITTYKNKENLIFKGNFEIQNGSFSFSFRLPKNINYQPGFSKLNFYAWDKSSFRDAKSNLSTILIGGSAKEFPVDNNPPLVTLFLNDSTFISGSKVGINPLLMAEISDESGINITNTAVGQDLTAVLTNEESTEYELNNYFEPKLNDYKAGTIKYPFRNLKEGKYTLSLKAWDFYNNSSEQKIEFTVVKNYNIKITEVFNFPNPFSDKTGTTFSITQDHLEEDIEVELEVFTSDGKMVKNFRSVIYKSDSKISDIKWDGKDNSGNSLPLGVYIYKIKLRSLSDSNRGVESKRLVLIN
jgi:hypothetical protein